MPQQKRHARSDGVVQTTTAPSVRSQVFQHEVGLLNSQTEMVKLHGLQNALNTFTGKAQSAIATVNQGLYEKQMSDIHRANEEEKRLGKLHADMGQSLEDAPEAMQKDYDYLDSFYESKGTNTGHQAYRDWLENVYNKWTPEMGDISQITGEFLQNEFGHGTGNPQHDNAMFNAFYNRAESKLVQAKEAAVKQQQAKATEELTASIHTEFHDPQYGYDQYLSQVNRARAILPKEWTLGQVHAWVMGRNMNAMVASEDEGDKRRFNHMLYGMTISPDGRTFADMFPEQAVELSTKAISERRQQYTIKADEESLALEKAIDEARSSNDLEALANLGVEVKQFESQFGAEAVSNSLLARLDEAQTTVAKNVDFHNRMSTCMNGGMCNLTDKEYERLPEFLKDISPFDPNLSDMEAQARTTQVANVLHKTLRGRDKLPKSVGSYLANALSTTTDPKVQARAFETLSQLEATDPTLPARILTGNDDALAMYSTLAATRDISGIEQTLELLNNKPEIMRWSKEATLSNMFGVEDEAAGADLFFNGTTFDGVMGLGHNDLRERLYEEGLISDPESTSVDPDSEVGRKMVGLAKRVWATERAAGRTPDPWEIRERVIEMTKGNLHEVRVHDDRSLLEHLTDEPPAVLEWGPGPRVSQQAIDDTQARLKDLGEIIGYTGDDDGEIVMVRDKALASRGQYVLRHVTPDNPLGTQVVIPANGEVTLTGEVEREFIGQTDDPVAQQDHANWGPIQKKIKVKLTGNPEADMKTLKESGVSFPRGVILQKAPGSNGYYRLVVEPVEDDSMSDYELQEKAKEIMNGKEPEASDLKNPLLLEMLFPSDGTRKFLNDGAQKLLDSALGGLRNLFQAEGKVSPTEGVTKLGSEPRSFDKPSGFVAKLADDTLARKGPSGLEHPADREGYSTRRFEFISKHEGYRSGVYADTNGFKTVGYGFNMDAEGAKEIWKAAIGDTESFDAVYSGKKRISKAMGRKLFDASVANAERFVATRFQGVPLKEHQRLSLVSLAYNNPSLIGPNLTAQVREGRWEDAVNEILWKSNAKKVKGLAVRRYHEAEMFHGMANDIESALPAAGEYLKNFG